MRQPADRFTDLSADALAQDIPQRCAYEAVTATRMADAVRAMGRSLAAGRSARAESSLAMADVVTALWTRFHKFDGADPEWPDRDRFVFSADHGPALPQALEMLSSEPPPRGAESGAASRSAGHGIGHAVGLALAERLLAARFGRSLVDHRIWATMSTGDLTGGLSHEAGSLAGLLQLGRLTVLWEDRSGASGSAEGDTLRRFAGYGWAVRRLDGHDPADLASAATAAMRSPRPTLLACHIRSEPDIGVAPSSTHALPEAVTAQWAAIGMRGAAPRRAWLKRLARHPLRAEFDRVTRARLPETLHEALDGLRAAWAGSRPAMATRAANQHVLEAIVPAMPELVGSSAEPEPGPELPGGRAKVGATTADLSTRHVSWGRREQAMAAAMNGLAAHGGVVPYAAFSASLADHMRPALRLAARAGRQVIHVLTDIEDWRDAGHDAVMQLAGLRSIPNVAVFRPADAMETAECWALALGRHDGPSLLMLSRQAVPSLRGPGPAGENRCARGGYVVAEVDGTRQATLLATGPEVATAMAARELLRGEGVRVAVVSLPCWEVFAKLDEAARAAVLGTAPRIGIEAACGIGWSHWLGGSGLLVGAGGGSEGVVLALRPSAADVVAAVRRGIA